VNRMFQDNYLISIGQLPDVLDGKGLIAHTVKYKELHDKRYDIELSLSLQTDPILRDHIGFIIPTISFFDKNLVDALTGGTWKLKKILIAITEFKQSTDINRYYDIGKASLTEHWGKTYPTLRGCAQILPFSDAEKLLCNIHGILYE
jgi:hypothetical protein